MTADEEPSPPVNVAPPLGATLSPMRIAHLALLALLVASCKKTTGETRTVDIAADAQGTPSKPVKVDVSIAAGTLKMVGGGGHVVGGSAQSNVKALDPKVTTTPDSVTIVQGSKDADPAPYRGLVADWSLQLGPTPMDLVVNAGAGKTDIRLGSSPVHSLAVHAGAGTVNVDCDEKNPVSADAMTIDAGAGAVDVKDLGNFGAAKLSVHTTVGSVNVDFGDHVDREMTLDVGSAAGSITVHVPAGVPARADVTDGPVKAPGWTHAGAAYVTAGGATSPRLTVHVKAVAGTVTLIAGS